MKDVSGAESGLCLASGSTPSRASPGEAEPHHDWFHEGLGKIVVQELERQKL